MSTHTATCTQLPVNDLEGSSVSLQQMHTYSQPKRDPRGRIVTTAFLAIAPNLPEAIGGTDARRADWVEVEESFGSEGFQGCFHVPHLALALACRQLVQGSAISRVHGSARSPTYRSTTRGAAGAEAELAALRSQLLDAQNRLEIAEQLRVAPARRLEVSEQQRRLAKRLRDRAFAQAEEARQRLAMLEIGSASITSEMPAITHAGSTPQDVLMGETDQQVAEEILERVDRVLSDEADSIVEEGLAGTVELQSIKAQQDSRKDFSGNRTQAAVLLIAAIIVAIGIAAVYFIRIRRHRINIQAA